MARLSMSNDVDCTTKTTLRTSRVLRQSRSAQVRALEARSNALLETIAGLEAQIAALLADLDTLIAAIVLTRARRNRMPHEDAP